MHRDGDRLSRIESVEYENRNRLANKSLTAAIPLTRMAAILSIRGHIKPVLPASIAPPTLATRRIGSEPTADLSLPRRGEAGDNPG